MPDEVGTETTRSDAPSADDNLFGEAANDKDDAAVEEEDSTDRTEEDGQGSDETGEQDAEAGTEAAQDPQNPETAGEPDNEGETTETDDLKVVVSIKGGRATIGVQKPSSDPHIETFDDLDESGLTQEVAAVIERARARWEDAPKHPSYARPVPVRPRNRRGQGSAQATTTEGEEAQQATLSLF